MEMGLILRKKSKKPPTKMRMFQNFVENLILISIKGTHFYLLENQIKSTIKIQYFISNSSILL